LEKTIVPSRTTSNWLDEPSLAFASNPAALSSAARLAARRSYPLQTGQYRISMLIASSLIERGMPGEPGDADGTKG
jgi:hypothetical protein